MLKLDARISKFLQHCSLFLKFQQNYFDDPTKLFSDLYPAKLFFPCIYNICGIFYNNFKNINLLCAKIWHLKFYLERCEYNFAIIAHFFLYIQGHILVKFIEITWSR